MGVILFLLDFDAESFSLASESFYTFSVGVGDDTSVSKTRAGP